MKTNLKKQLERANLNADHWENKYWEVRGKLDKYEEEGKNKFINRINDYDRLANDMQEMNRQMLEIVRWHVNPETAKKDKLVLDKYGNPIYPPQQ